MTMVPAANGSLQSPGQTIPAGLLVTVPGGPATVTVRVCCGIGCAPPPGCCAPPPPGFLHFRFLPVFGLHFFFAAATVAWPSEAGAAAAHIEAASSATQSVRPMKRIPANDALVKAPRG